MEYVHTYKSEIQEIPLLRKNLFELAENWAIPESELRQIGVIIEELFSNIVRFGYKDKKEHKVEISMNRIDDVITIIIIDDGIPFNPLNYKAGPITDPLASEAGGMGITLIQTFSDSIVYNRIDQKNQLQITKRIKSKP